MKKTACILLLCIILSATAVAMTSCGAEPPQIDTIRHQLVETIEKAVDINTVLYGAGLPVYKRDGEEEDLYHRYYSAQDEDTEYVMRTYARYTSCEDIENAVREVYAESYADSIITTVLTGFAVSEAGLTVPARYQESENGLLQSISYGATVSGTRLFDYSSMEIIANESTGTYIKVSILSRVDAPGSEWKKITLSFSREGEGWLLAAPSC